MDAGGDKVKVCVRCRPMSSGEQKQGCKTAVTIDTIRCSVDLQNPTSADSELPKQFTFDVVFAQDSKQVDVYNTVARPIVDSVLEGYNGTIFAYGQTGTGKTFTMEGVRSAPELRGIIPNSFAHIFGAIAKGADQQRFLVRVSYLEIYNEDVRDLLGKDQLKRLELKERPDTGVYVKDLTMYAVNNADDMDRLMNVGNKNRSVGATNMNEQSSRSHAIFSVTVERSEVGADKEEHVRVGKLHLVDLAGSERQAKTGATGDRLREATKINLSLSTLGNVISALVDGRSSHIPYRNSKLTRLLQDSLGGNSKTLMIANFGPAGYNYDETMSTLRYANRAKNIKNSAKINEDPKDALLRQYQEEIEALRRQLGEGGGGPGELTSLPPEQLAELKAKLESDRRRLQEEAGMAEEEKRRVEEEMQQTESALAGASAQQAELASKLAKLEKKVIVGGENLLEKAEQQQALLEEGQGELDTRKEREAALRSQLEQTKTDRLDLEEKYSGLAEENESKTRKLKKVWSMLMSGKSEIAELQQEHQREMEDLLDSIRSLSRDIKLQLLVIESCIPMEYQRLIEQNVQWSEAQDEWQLRAVAYTGNNMKKSAPPDAAPVAEFDTSDCSFVYMRYSSDENTSPNKPAKKQRPPQRRPDIAKLLK